MIISLRLRVVFVVGLASEVIVGVVLDWDRLTIAMLATLCGYWVRLLHVAVQQRARR